MACWFWPWQVLFLFDRVYRFSGLDVMHGLGNKFFAGYVFDILFDAFSVLFLFVISPAF